VDLTTNKVGGGMLYDKTDEVEAFARGNLFGYGSSNDPDVQLKILNPKAYVDKFYSNLPEGPNGIGRQSIKSYEFMREKRKEKYRCILN
jgi:hypothetical protein